MAIDYLSDLYTNRLNKITSEGPRTAKYLDSMLTLVEKTEWAAANRNDKVLSLDGYVDVTPIDVADGDTLTLQTSSGEMLNSRLATNDGFYFDAIEVGHGNRRKNYGYREDGTPKGSGWLGELPMTDGSGDTATELAATFTFDFDEGPKEVLAPLLTPNLSKSEINYLLSGGTPTAEIDEKARSFALSRLREGKSPFKDEDSLSDDIYANPAKRRIQPRLVSQLTGVPINQLTDDHFEFVGQQQKEELARRLSQGRLKAKILGKDQYGRSLVDLVDTDTMTSISSSLANDPRINAGFSVGRSNKDPILTSAIEDSFQRAYRNRKYGNIDSLGGKLGNMVDIAQSGFYQFAGTLINGILNTNEKDSWVNKWNDARRAEGKPGWDDLANRKIAQAVADDYAGVNPEARIRYATAMQEAGDALDRGDYFDAFTGYASQIGNILADSATQTGALTIGAVAAAIATPFTGGTSIPAYISTVGTILGGSAVVAQMSLDAIEEYKDNNNGKEPPRELVAKIFAYYGLTTFGETLLLHTGISKLFTNPVKAAFHQAPKNVLRNFGEGILFGGAGEFFQEHLETTGDLYFPQNENERKAYLDILFSKNALKGSIPGMMAGAAMGGGTAFTAIPSSYLYSKWYDRATKAKEERKELATNTTVTGAKANVEASNSVVERISSFEATPDKVKVLDDLLAESNDLSQEAEHRVKLKRAELAYEIAKETGQGKQEAYTDLLAASDPNGQFNFEGLLTDEAITKNHKELQKKGKALGLNEQEIKKAFLDAKIKSSNLDWELALKRLETATGEHRALLLNTLSKAFVNEENELRSLQDKLLALNDNISANSYVTERGYRVEASDVASNSARDVGSTKYYLEAIKKNISNLRKTISSHMEEILKLKSDYNLTSEKELARIEKSIENSIVGIKKKAQENIKNNLTSTQIRTAATNYNRAKSAGKDNSTLRKAWTNLTNQSVEALTEAKKDATPEVASLIDEVVKEKQEIAKGVEETGTKKEEVIKTANKLKNKFSKEAIDKLKSFTEANELYKELKDIADDVNDQWTLFKDKELGNLKKDFNEAYKKLKEKANDLRLKEAKEKLEAKAREARVKGGEVAGTAGEAIKDAAKEVKDAYHRIVNIFKKNKVPQAEAAAIILTRLANTLAELRGEAVEDVLNRLVIDRNINTPAEGIIMHQAGAKGRIDFLSSGVIKIIFGPKADVSTALHEFGHLYIEEALRIINDDKIQSPYKDKLREDIENLARFVGITKNHTDLDSWTEDAHERGAEAFEKYFAEGKAPDESLKGIFQTMKKILLGIYWTAKNILGLSLSDNVRTAFNRALMGYSYYDIRREVFQISKEGKLEEVKPPVEVHRTKIVDGKRVEYDVVGGREIVYDRTPPPPAPTKTPTTGPVKTTPTKATSTPVTPTGKQVSTPVASSTTTTELTAPTKEAPESTPTNTTPTRKTRLETIQLFTPQNVRKYRNRLFIFGDNLVRRGKAGQAVIRDEPNAFGIPTKRVPAMTPDSFFSDKPEEIKIVKGVLEELRKKFDSGKYEAIVLPRDGIGTGLAKLAEKSPEINRLIKDFITSIYRESKQNASQEIPQKAPEASKTNEQKAAPTTPPVSKIKPVEHVMDRSGRTIDGITLNKDQDKAYEEILDFFRKKEVPAHSLIGYAGTGKTTLLKLIYKAINSEGWRDISFFAPTHRASSVIHSKTPGVEVNTIHAMLGLSPEVDLDDYDAKKLEFKSGSGKTRGMNYDGIAIVDESSMINDKLYADVMKAIIEHNMQVLFVGDDAQLQPVKQKSKSKALSSSSKTSTLSIVERADNSHLLSESMYIRESGEFSGETHLTEDGKGVEFTRDKGNFISKAIEMFKSKEFLKNPLLLRVVAGTNAAVAEYNKRIREAIFGKDVPPLTKSDILMAYNSWSETFGQPGILNSMDYAIESVREGTRTIEGVNTTGYYISVKQVNFGESKKDSHPMGCYVLLDVPEKLRAVLENKNKEMRRSYSVEKYKEFQNILRQFTTMRDITYKNEKGETRTLVKKTFDYGYAHTIHKSQGGTYTNIFVDEDSINRFPDADTRKQLRYVGLTRAESTAVVLSSSAQVTQRTEASQTGSKLIDSKPQPHTSSKPTTEQDYEDYGAGSDYEDDFSSDEGLQAKSLFSKSTTQPSTPSTETTPEASQEAPEGSTSNDQDTEATTLPEEATTEEKEDIPDNQTEPELNEEEQEIADVVRNFLKDNSTDTIENGKVVKESALTIFAKKFKEKLNKEPDWTDIKDELAFNNKPSSKVWTNILDPKVAGEALELVKQVSIDGITKATSYWMQALGSSPALQLLYKWKPTSRDNEMTPFIREEALNVIVYGVMDYFSNMSIGDFIPSSNDEIIRAFTLERSDPELYEKIPKFRKIAKEFGVFRTIHTYNLGRDILHHMGLKPNRETATTNFYDRLAEDVGVLAIKYAVKAGIITENKHTITSESPFYGEGDKYADHDRNIYFLKLEKSNKNKIRELRRSWNSWEKVFGNEENKARGPKSTPYSVPPFMKVQGTRNLMTVPYIVRNYILPKIMRTKYKIQDRLAGIVFDEKQFSKEEVLRKLGWKNGKETALLHHDDRVAQESINLGAESSYYEMKDLWERGINEGKEDWYFNYSVTRNGRYNIDANTVNPQSDKFHRFMITPALATVTMNMADADTYDAAAFALAQAFDKLHEYTEDKDFSSRIREFADRVFKMDPDELMNDFVKLPKKEFEKKYDLGTESFGQTLHAIQFLKDFKDAPDKSNFQASLMTENDSTTSGYFIRLLQFPFPKLRELFGVKLGVIDKLSGLTQKEMLTIDDLKSIPGFLDIYKTIAKEALEILPGLVNDKKFMESTDGALFQLMNKLNLIPKANPDNSISSDMRKLHKNAAVPFGYTAGSKSIKRNMAEALYKPILTAFIAGDANAIQFMSEVAKIGGTTINTLRSELMKKSVSDVWLRVKGKPLTLDRVLSSPLANTFGQAAWDSLSNNFKDTVRYSNAISKAVNTMYDLFAKALKMRMEVLENHYGKNKIPIKVEAKMMSEMTRILPSVRMFWNNFTDNHDESLLLLDTERLHDKEIAIKSRYRGEDGEPQSNTSFANIRKFKDAGQAGAVLPIHADDGIGMGMQYLRHGDEMLGVHDATVISFLKGKQASYDYNLDMFLTNKEYNMFDEIVKRLKEIAHTLNGMEGFPDVMSMLSREYEINEIGEREYIPIRDFIKQLDEMRLENKAVRDEFFDQDIQIANMAGPPGSAPIISKNMTIDNHDILKPIRKDGKMRVIIKHLKEQGADPDTFVPGAKLDDLGNVLGNNEEIFDRLQAQDPRPENEEHLKYLKELTGRINPKAIKDLTVELFDGIKNTGRLIGNTIQVALDKRTSPELDRTTRLNPLTHKSLAEIYAHEQVHAVIDFGFDILKDSPMKAKYIREALWLQKQAMNVIKVEHFLPEKSVYDAAHPTLRAVYEDRAKKLWDYVFNQSGKEAMENLSALKEFITYSMTNETIRNELAKVTIPHKTLPAKSPFDMGKPRYKLLDRIISFGIALMDMVSGKGSMKDMFKKMKEIALGNRNERTRENFLVAVEKLYDRLNEADRKGLEHLWKHPLRIFENLFAYMGEYLRKGDDFIGPKLRALTNIADTKGWSYFDIKNNPHANTFDKVKMWANLLAMWPVSKQRRTHLPRVMNKMGMLNQQGSTAMVARDMMGPDFDTSNLQLLGSSARQIERSSQAVASQAYWNLVSHFDRELDDNEKESLTRTILLGDLSALYDGKESMDYILDLLKDTPSRTDEWGRTRYAKIDDEIVKIEEKLQDSKYFYYYTNQAHLLGRSMATGEMVTNQNLNPENIQTGLGTGTYIKYDKEIVKLIDKLATLYALEYTDPAHLAIAGGLNRNGLENFLINHNTFKKESISNRIVDRIHQQKGYIKSLYDDTIDMKVVRLADVPKMKLLGYTAIRPGDKPIGPGFTGQKDLVIMTRKWNAPKRIDGAAYMSNGQRAFGMPLMGTSLMIEREMDPDTSSTELMPKAIALKEVFIKEAEAEKDKLNKLMMARPLTVKQVNAITRGKNYAPIASPTGGYSDYRMVMKHEDKVRHLGMDLNAFEVMSRMFAANFIKQSSPNQNKIVSLFLEQDMLNNMLTSSHVSKEGKAYARVSENSTNKYIKEMWVTAPEELKNLVKKYQNKGGFWVREDWLPDMLGVRSLSLTDAKILNNHAWLRKSVALGEFFIKHLTYIAKTNIVVRLPAVLIGNIMSNLWYTVSMGLGTPQDVFARTWRNAGHVKEYMMDRKELDSIEFKKRLGTATEGELRQINLLKTKLYHNPLHNLMQKGFYQSIIEDLTPDKINSVGKVNKYLASKTKNWNPKLKWGLRQLMMAEGTPVHDFLFQIVQYSDFVARATYYDLEMERVSNPKLRNGKANPNYIEKYKAGGKKVLTDKFKDFETRLTHQTWNAFVNYDKPQGKGLQYLNDMGFIMFTKWATRISSVITNGLMTRPISALLFLVAMHGLNPVPYPFDSDIFESNPVTRNWWNLLSTPIGIAMDAIPIPIQVMLGLQPYPW